MQITTEEIFRLAAKLSVAALACHDQDRETVQACVDAAAALDRVAERVRVVGKPYAGNGHKPAMIVVDTQAIALACIGDIPSKRSKAGKK